jgi:hypothetical protein
MAVMNWIKYPFLVALFLLVTPAFGQCEKDDFMDKCASNLGTYTFVKSFNIKAASGDKKTEFSYVFSKGSTYMVVCCDQGNKGGRMIVNLYDRNHKLIASNYNKATKKFYPTITYPCGATGVYYIECYFENGKSGCGLSILGFTKTH